MGTPPLSDTPRMGFPMPPRTHLDMKGGRSETDGAICASDNAHVNSAIERPHRSGTKASLTARKELAQAVGKSVDYGTEANKTEGKLDTSGAGSFDVPRSAPPIVATTSLSDEKVSTSRTQFSTSKISRKAISFGKAPSGPPTIPLPTPPAVMASEISTDLSSSPSDTSLLLPSTPVRTRSNTSIPLPNSATFTRRSLLTVKGDIAGDTDLALPAKVIMAKVESGIERASKDGDRINPKLLAQDSDASSEQLRRALLSQLAKFDHLAGYVLSLTQKHEDEKTSLVQRIEELQREIKKRDREIKGLRWLVVNGAAVAGQSGSTPGSAPTTGQRERSLSSSHSRQSTVETIGQQLRREYADDSEKCYLTPALEAESPTTGSLDNSDGATVLQRSSTVKHTLAPGSQACGWRLSPKQFRRKSSPVVNVYGKAEPGAGLGLGMGPLPPATTSSDSEVVSARSALGTRASSSSLSSSASTVPTMTAASTASSGLSAILESPPQSSDGTSEFPRSIIPEEGKRREKDERRAIKALRRISSSSSKSGSSVHVTATPPCPPLPPDAAASTSYASNLRKGAMPSIDNVLGRSVTDEKMEHVLARLRLLGEAVNR
ncbi:hypothetical protein PUNSTDRAFT_140759 [Punctularia strigosozonata HHB-11173 SS5]|uniref:uncharacterized protein n=1 Tax=Punctularia strigosozonata (strain HHB-11173) TaxID=741275 RepID=UPI000441706A|nr:uncharacterized protein PUNSTDRAFT_140759 [Punctularia strigosozonata HHB-11173 SS5]EIN14474.1 hypothetical protein PUNSTDRAFT_140759 [Punctularia strigosozonata HHB-11173 SS5]